MSFEPIRLPGPGAAIDLFESSPATMPATDRDAALRTEAGSTGDLEKKVTNYTDKLKAAINEPQPDGKLGNPQKLFEIMRELNEPDNAEYKQRVFKSYKTLIADIMNNDTNLKDGVSTSSFNKMAMLQVYGLMASGNNEVTAGLISLIVNFDIKKHGDGSVTKEGLIEVIDGMVSGENYLGISNAYAKKFEGRILGDDLRNFSPELAEVIGKDITEYKEQEAANQQRLEEEAREAEARDYRESVYNQTALNSARQWVKSQELMEWLETHPDEADRVTKYFETKKLRKDGLPLHVGERDPEVVKERDRIRALKAEGDKPSTLHLADDMNAREAQNLLFRKLLDDGKIKFDENPAENLRIRKSLIPTHVSEYQQMKSPYVTQEDVDKWNTDKQSPESIAKRRAGRIQAVEDQVQRWRDFDSEQAEKEAIRTAYQREIQEKRYEELYVQPARELWARGELDSKARDRFSTLPKNLRDKIVNEHFAANPTEPMSRYVVSAEVAAGYSDGQLESLRNSGQYGEEERQAVRTAAIQSGDLKTYSRYVDIVEKPDSVIKAEAEAARQQQYARREQESIIRFADVYYKTALKAKNPDFFKNHIISLVIDGKASEETIKLLDKKAKTLPPSRLTDVPQGPIMYQNFASEIWEEYFKLIQHPDRNAQQLTDLSNFISSRSAEEKSMLVEQYNSALKRYDSGQVKKTEFGRVALDSFGQALAASKV